MPAASTFPYTRPITVEFHHIDALRHVNNVAYLRWLESARIDFLSGLIGAGDAHEAPVVIGDIYCRYLAPAYYREQLRLGLGVSRFGRKSFDIVYQLDAVKDGRAIIRAKSTMVTYDVAAGRSILIPADMRNAIDEFQGSWVFDSSAE